MPRSAAEINAEAQRLRHEAGELAAVTQARLQEAQQTINAAAQTAQGAQDAADQAVAATGANNILVAEGHCATARSRLALARSNAAQAFAGVAGGDPKDEWKECRTSIDRFDKLLVDLRKTGFGFITAIVGAAALLQSQVAGAPELKFSVFVIIY
jgi:hypothetical protein